MKCRSFTLSLNLSHNKERREGEGGHVWFSHLVFVEFQYTMCLLATAAETKLKRKIVAFQAGRAPGVHIREPILTSARGRAERLCTGWVWWANQGEGTQQNKELGEQVSPAASPTHEQTQDFYVICCCSYRMMHVDKTDWSRSKKTPQKTAG